VVEATGENGLARNGNSADADTSVAAAGEHAAGNRRSAETPRRAAVKTTAVGNAGGNGHANGDGRAAAGNGRAAQEPRGGSGNGPGAENARAASGTNRAAAPVQQAQQSPAGQQPAKPRTRRPARTARAAAPDADNAPTAEMPAVSEAEDTAVRAKQIPEAAVARLAVYLRILSGLAEQGATTVSSEELSVAAGVNSAKLRKDLSYLGSYGTRGVGYEVQVLVSQIERILGLTRQHRVAVVGIGNLGHALANYGGFPGRGFPVDALFDLDPDLIGVPVGGLPVSHLDEIPQVCSEREISVGIIATPPTAAQSVCDRLVAGGVQCILNFAPVVLQVPAHVEVRKVDLAVELQILSFLVARRADRASAALENQGDAGLPGTGLPTDNDSAGSTGNGRNGAGTDGGLGMVVR
jgi:redox-sensing transcriptional repressor